MFWFLLILLNNFRNHFIFYIMADIDEVMLIDKTKGQRLNSFRVFSLCNSKKKAFWFLLLIVLNNFRNLFIFCITIDIDKILLSDKSKGIWSMD